MEVQGWVQAISVGGARGPWVPEHDGSVAPVVEGEKIFTRQPGGFKPITSILWELNNIQPTSFRLIQYTVLSQTFSLFLSFDDSCWKVLDTLTQFSLSVQLSL